RDVARQSLGNSSAYAVERRIRFRAGAAQCAALIAPFCKGLACSRQPLGLIRNPLRGINFILIILDPAMTTVGDILNEFFSPISKEKLWVMPEDDHYTKIVRKWNPVIQSANRTKFNLSTNCSAWQSLYVSRSSWKPTMTDSPKPGAYRDFVPSPPGT